MRVGSVTGTVSQSGTQPLGTYVTDIYSQSARGKMGFPDGSVVKNPPAMRLRKLRFDPWLGKSPGEESGNPFQYSCQVIPPNTNAKGKMGIFPAFPPSQISCLNTDSHEYNSRPCSSFN